MTRLLRSLLLGTPLQHWPVRIRSGIAQGARWTLFPWTSYWRGNHEPAVQNFLVGLGGGDVRGWCCWDIGAHFGLYSVGLARRVGETGEVAAFEPNPRSYARLARHARMNRLGWLKLFPLAASDLDGMAELLTYGDLGTTTTHLPYEGESVSGAGAISIRTCRLDTLLDRGTLRPPRFVKIDAEGHGHRVLAGMARTIENHRPIILVGVHSPTETVGVLAALRPLGYSHRPVTGDELTAVTSNGDYLFTPPSA